MDAKEVNTVVQNIQRMLKITDRQPGEWTYEDLANLPQDGSIYEIIDGVLYVSKSPSWKHQDVSLNLAIPLSLHCKSNGLGKAFCAPLDVIFTHKSVVQPDLVFVRRDRLGVVVRVIEGSPDLAVEILSTNPRLDRVRKMNLYARWKVPHYWIVDPEGLTLESYRLSGKSYVVEWTGGDDDIFRPSLFPDLEIPLQTIWPSLE